MPTAAVDEPLLGRTQIVVATTLALVPSIYLFLVGCFLFVIPTHCLRLLLVCDGVDSPVSALDVRMARLVGCVLLGQVLSCLSLLYPLAQRAFSSSTQQRRQQPRELRQGCPVDAAILDKFRSAVAGLFLLGLLTFCGGLVNDRTRDQFMISWEALPCSSLQSTVIVATGALTILFSCGSMMVSFWPTQVSIVDSTAPNEESTSSRTSRRRTRVRFTESVDNDARVPLLSNESVTNSNNDNINDNQSDVEATAVSRSDEHLLNETNELDAVNHENGVQATTSTTIIPDPSNEASNPSNSYGNTQEPTSRIQGTTRLLKLAAPQVFYLYVGCAVLLVRLPFSLSIPHFVSTTLGAVSHNDFAGARVEILLLFILGTIDAALDFWCIFLFGYANQRIVRGVRIDTFLSILKQEMAFFDQTTSGELASRLNSDCGEMAGDLTWFFRFSIESIVRISGIVTYMMIRCPILGGCALTIVPAVALVNKVYGNWLNKNAREVQDALAEANHVAQETFSCIRTVIAFASEQEEYRKYKECIDHQYKLNIRQLYISGVYYMMISTFLINTVVQATLLLIGTSLIQHGKLTGEILLAFMLYQGQLQSETMNLFQSYTSLVKSSGAGDKVFSLLDRRPSPPGTGSSEVLSSEVEVENDDERSREGQQEDAIQESPQQVVVKESCSIEMKDVHFSYPCRPDNKVLSGFNLSIPQGETYALVGSSGCGKSTVVSLLQRLYDPNSGSILIDGKELRCIDVKQHRRKIGIVTQDPILFKGTIMSNITYGCPSISRDQAIQAAQMANALDFILSFRDGFDTDVGERGTQISGGQKQRLSIARAIVRRPSLLLLDEATSALDPESEQAVQVALDMLLKTNQDMTTVIVAHRLQTVRNADKIVVIEDGRVTEIGKHEELLKIPGGRYLKMVQRAGSDGQLPDH